MLMKYISCVLVAARYRPVINTNVKEITGHAQLFRTSTVHQCSLDGQQAPQGLRGTLTKSSAVTGCPSLSLATTILPSRSFMSARLSVKASTAMISLATAMSNCA